MSGAGGSRIFPFESTIELRKSSGEAKGSRIPLPFQIGYIILSAVESIVRKSREKEIAVARWKEEKRRNGYFRRKLGDREVSPRYEDRPRGYLLLRLVYATSYYSTPTTCLFLLPTLSTFIRRLFLPLHPANTLFSISQPDQLRCSLPLPRVCVLCLLSVSVSRVIR